MDPKERERMLQAFAAAEAAAAERAGSHALGDTGLGPAGLDPNQMADIEAVARNPDSLPAPPTMPAGGTSGDRDLLVPQQATPQPVSPVGMGSAVSSSSSSTTQTTPGLDLTELEPLTAKSKAEAETAAYDKAWASEELANAQRKELLATERLVKASQADSLVKQGKIQGKLLQAEDMQGEVEQKIKDFELKKGNRVFKNGSGIAQGIALMISAGMQGFAQSLGARGPNTALAVMDDLIRQDENLQKSALQKMGRRQKGFTTKLEFYTRQLGNEKAAASARAAEIYGQGKMAIERAKLHPRVQGTIIEARLAEQQAMIAEREEAKKLEAIKLSQDRTTKSSTFSSSKTPIRMGTAGAMGAPTKPPSDPVIKQFSDLDELEQNLSELEAAVKSSSLASRAVGKAGFGEGSLVNKLADQVRDSAAKANQSGTLTEPDKKSYSYDSGTTRNAILLKQIAMGRKKLARKRAVLAKSYGGKYDVSQFSRPTVSGVKKR